MASRLLHMPALTFSNQAAASRCPLHNKSNQTLHSPTSSRSHIHCALTCGPCVRAGLPDASRGPTPERPLECSTPRIQKAPPVGRQIARRVKLSLECQVRSPTLKAQTSCIYRDVESFSARALLISWNRAALLVLSIPYIAGQPLSNSIAALERYSYPTCSMPSKSCTSSGHRSSSASRLPLLRL